MTSNIGNQSIAERYAEAMLNIALEKNCMDFSPEKAQRENLQKKIRKKRNYLPGGFFPGGTVLTGPIGCICAERSSIDDGESHRRYSRLSLPLFPRLPGN